MQQKIYDMVTEKIISSLENGVIPWRKPWNSCNLMNLVTKKAYRGINIWLLGTLKYTSPFYASFKQVKELGGSVKKGEHGNLVVFWKWIEKKTQNQDGEEENEKYAVLRYYWVFNIEQCLNIPENKIPNLQQIQFNPIEQAENIVNNMPNCPPIEYIGQRACYSLTLDVVKMPAQDTFENPEYYYSTLFHELIHSTGHSSRLNRFAKEKEHEIDGNLYSKEELVAELGAAFLSTESRIEQKTIENSTSYIAGWLDSLNKNRRFVIYAAAQAQKATDYILNKQRD